MVDVDQASPDSLDAAAYNQLVGIVPLQTWKLLIELMDDGDKVIAREVIDMAQGQVQHCLDVPEARCGMAAALRAVPPQRLMDYQGWTTRMQCLLQQIA